MTDYLLPYLFLFVPFLFLFYMAVEIYLRNTGRALNRLTALIVLLYACSFLGDYLMQTMPYEIAWFALRYIKFVAFFANMTVGMYFIQIFCKSPVRPFFFHISSLVPLIGLFYVLSDASWLGASVHQGPIWRSEEHNGGLVLLVSIFTVYTTASFFIHLVLAFRRVKSKPWIVHERKRFNIFLWAVGLMMLWIVLCQILLEVLPWINPYLQFDIISSYGLLIYCWALRYAMVNYDFISTYDMRYKKLFNNFSNGIVILNEENKILDANPVSLRMMGLVDPSDDSWRNRHAHELMSLKEDSDGEQRFEQLLSEKIPFSTDIRMTNPLNESYEIEVNVDFFEIEGELWSFFMIKDITEQKANEQKLAYLAYHDPLTRLHNRRRFYEKLVGELLSMEAADGMLTVMLIDLDQFKWINDTLGHFAGDELLILVAERLKAVVPDNGCVARMGGDEFVVLMPDLHSDYEIEDLAREIINELRKPFLIDNRPFQITASVGISIAPRDGRDAETIVKCADTAMYAAKKAGRDQFMKYLPIQRVAAEQALVLVNGLRNALENDEFTLHYQPQLDLSTGRLIGVEALLRWYSSDLGHQSPADFIPIAEETGAIVPIGDWVLRTAIIQGKKWMESGHPDLVMSVNLSALQLKDPQLSFRLADFLRENDYPAGNLCLEITESTAIGNLEQTLSVCSEIVRLGVTLSIDDFGTGYSSLSMLSRFPFRTVKIDKSLIRDIEMNPKDAAIIQTIVRLSSHLKMDVVAEGVETEAQLTILKDIGCHQVQGYLCGLPMPSREFDKLLVANHY
ncbi:EAL domain-containing protein [Cohnella sp.]|uniref:EAL domain-containing protein n=1 Tax=Cohnella sp. TaxID=1883426 RepID=UPI003564E864